MKAQTPSDLEAAIRRELGIPDSAQHVLILSMDAHMDWDWQVTFQDYLKAQSPKGQQPKHMAVTEIISQAFQLMQQSGSPPGPPYYYSICEMGFFEAAVKLNPSLTQNFQADIGDKLRIVGGGVTSPDNLLPHGEAILRNYLVGQEWMQRTFSLPLRQAYVPDDFGHDSQFPVLVAAMGLMGVSFSRIPGSPNQEPPAQAPAGGETLNSQLVLAGVDFVWQVNDGSTTIAHYMQDTYCQGLGIENDSVITNIHTYLASNQLSAPTPYIYVPCGCDFATPIQNLVEDATEWNQARFHDRPDDVYAVVATLDHYLQLVSTYVDPTVEHPYGPYRYLATTTFSPTPYWTGYYASRIRNKILHQAATRALLGAETVRRGSRSSREPRRFRVPMARQREAGGDLERLESARPQHTPRLHQRHGDGCSLHQRTSSIARRGPGARRGRTQFCRRTDRNPGPGDASLRRNSRRYFQSTGIRGARAVRGTYDPSALIFRIYQPTTSPLDVTVTLASRFTDQSGVEIEAQLVTALETPIAGSQPIPINNSTVAFPVPLALATLQVGPVTPSPPQSPPPN